MTDIRKCAEEVKEEIALAKAKADLQHQKFQEKEAKASKSQLKRLLGQSRAQDDRSKSMQLRYDEAKKGKRSFLKASTLG